MPELRKVKNNAPANHAPIIRENCASHEINAPRTAVNKKNAPESASTLHVRHLRHPRSRHLGERHVAHRRRAGLGEAAPAVGAAGGTEVGGVNVDLFFWQRQAKRGPWQRHGAGSRTCMRSPTPLVDSSPTIVPIMISSLRFRYTVSRKAGIRIGCAHGVPQIHPSCLA